MKQKLMGTKLNSRNHIYRELYPFIFFISISFYRFFSVLGNIFVKSKRNNYLIKVFTILKEV